MSGDDSPAVLSPGGTLPERFKEITKGCRRREPGPERGCRDRRAELTGDSSGIACRTGGGAEHVNCETTSPAHVLPGLSEDASRGPPMSFPPTKAPASPDHHRGEQEEQDPAAALAGVQG